MRTREFFACPRFVAARASEEYYDSKVTFECIWDIIDDHRDAFSAMDPGTLTIVFNAVRRVRNITDAHLVAEAEKIGRENADINPAGPLTYHEQRARTDSDKSLLMTWLREDVAAYIVECALQRQPEDPDTQQHELRAAQAADLARQAAAA